MSTTDFRPIVIPASRVFAAGITPACCAVWAIERHEAGKPEQAVRLLAACATLIEQVHKIGACNGDRRSKS